MSNLWADEGGPKKRKPKAKYNDMFTHPGKPTKPPSGPATGTKAFGDRARQRRAAIRKRQLELGEVDPTQAEKQAAAKAKAAKAKSKQKPKPKVKNPGKKTSTRRVIRRAK